MTKEEVIAELEYGEPLIDEIDAFCKYSEAIGMAILLYQKLWRNLNE